MAKTQYWRVLLAISVNCSAIGEKPSKASTGTSRFAKVLMLVVV